MKIKLQAVPVLPLLFILCFSLFLRTTPVSAANVSITGGTYGTACNSGGYFTPSSATINSGDTVTISVPVNDPYAGGLEIHGFPQGSFTVARGGSVTTGAITANVSYYGTWPSTGCTKGSGTIVATAPAQTPPNNSTPPSSSGTTPSSSSAATSTTTAHAAAPAAKTTPTTSASTQPASNAPTPPTTTVQPKDTNQPKTNVTSKTALQRADPKSPSFKTVAAVGASSLVFVGAGTFITWRIIIRRRLKTSIPQLPATQSLDPPATQYQGGPPNIGN